MLYQPFPSNWPKFTPKDRLADWLETYAINQDLLIWNSSYIESSPKPAYDDRTKRWTITVMHDSEAVVLRPAHIVLATGTLGKPHMPQVPLRDVFTGTVLHASDFKGANEYAGRHVLVVGAGNTAADVAQDLYTTG